MGPLSHRGFAVCRLVAVDHALADSLVQCPAGCDQLACCPVLVAGCRGLPELTNCSLERRLDGLVAQPRLLVGPDPLQLRLDVGHAFTFDLAFRRRCRCAARCTIVTVVTTGSAANPAPHQVRTHGWKY